MCQAKDKGGKRCAIHHHGTQAAIQTTVVKTNVDTPLVKEVFTELNKEGKKLVAPSREEFEGYLAKERFMTEIDPSINARDKKMIIKKLDKAAEENTPSGGTFHAWKNLMTTTINRYGKKAKLVLAAITLGTVISVTGGCAQIAPQSPPAGISSSSVVVEDAQVTDELGTYTKVKIKEDDPSLKLITGAGYDSAGIAAAGFTDADALAAQQYAVRFAATEMVDSPILDTSSSFDAYMNNTRSSYLTGQYVEDMVAKNSGLVYVQPDGLQFARDGKPRLTSNKLVVEAVTVTDGRIQVAGVSDVDYRVPDKNILTWYQARHPEMTSQQITDKLGLKDNKEETLRVKIGWTYWLEKDSAGAWKIAGFGNNFNGNIVGIDITK